MALGCVLALGALACGSRVEDDSAKSESAAPSTASTTSTTAARETTTTTAAQPTPTMSDEVSIFCTNAKPLGFNSLADIQPLDLAEARALQSRLDLLEASAPADAAAILATIRAITDPYLAAVIAGEIKTNDDVIKWGGTLDVPTLDATLAAVPQMRDYIATNCV